MDEILTREWALACLGPGKHTKSPRVFTVPREFGFTRVEPKAFDWFKGEAIVFPEGIKVIGEGACRGLENLRRVVLPETLVEIGKEAFMGCANLEAVELPSHLKRIGASAFSGCAIRKLVIPGSMYDVEKFAFFRCELLEDLKICEGVIYIGQESFGECRSLVKYHKWDLPRSVKRAVRQSRTPLNEVWHVTFAGSACLRTRQEKRRAERSRKFNQAFRRQISRSI